MFPKKKKLHEIEISVDPKNIDPEIVGEHRQRPDPSSSCTQPTIQ